jgi:hypothetical protein
MWQKMADPIQSLWFGEELSFLEQMSIKSFINHGHPYHLYLYQRFNNVPAGVIIEDANKIIPQKEIFTDHYGSFATFSDLFRYKLLLDKGGWWVDVDTICLRPFDFNTEYVFSSENLNNTSGKKTRVNSGMIKMPQGCNFAERCYLDSCRIALSLKPRVLLRSNMRTFFKRDLIKIRMPHWGVAGPVLLDVLVPEYGLSKFVQNPEVFCPLNHFDFKKAINSNWSFRIPSNAYSIHFWNELWRRDNIDKNIIYDQNCLYGRFQREILNIDNTLF